MRPRLRPAVQAHRQYFRGRMWHVLQDPSSNQFYRLNDAAYRFVGMLDGRRTVAEVWRACNEQFGDDAPTQGEAIQLLGQLYTSNLLQGEMPPDAEGLFQRYHKRRTREVQGYLMNLLFIRIPLFDPNRFLNRWVGLFGKVFSLPGFIVWLVLVSVGGYFVISNWDRLAGAARPEEVLDPSNLPLLYLSFIIIKAFHELGHAFACKKFGLRSGTGGDVHTIGIMFLVFTPLPYVDASSAWAFRSKWHRVLVGASGMLIEIGLAAAAAIAWANTAEGTPLNALCYNAMFIASVSTLLFNGNPLLRYDAYYILSDLLEIPNLAQRSKQYIYYLVKKYVWGVRQARNPAHTGGEKGWFAFYGVASTIYRVFICVNILLFVAKKFFFVGAALAVLAVVAWVLVPLGKFLHYLATSQELTRVRGRAVATTTVFLALVLGGIGLIPVADRSRSQGLVAAPAMSRIYVAESGRLAEFLPTDAPVQAGQVLFEQVNEELQLQRETLEMELARAKAQRELALEQQGQRPSPEHQRVTRWQAADQLVRAKQAELQRLEEMIDELTMTAPVDGMWVAPEIEHAREAFLQKGQQVGLVVQLDEPMIRAYCRQDEIGAVIEEVLEKGNEQARRVELRVKGRPDQQLEGRIQEIRDSGTDQLPSPSLGIAGGGSVPVRADDRRGVRTAERVFEIRIVCPAYDPDGPVQLRPGQRVMIRFAMSDKPLLAQWARDLRQLIQAHGGSVNRPPGPPAGL